MLTCLTIQDLIAPGLYPSEMTTHTTSNLDKFSGAEGHDDFPDAHKMAPSNCPAERTGSEQDFAGTVLFMASRAGIMIPPQCSPVLANLCLACAGAYLNGETLISDGGRMSQLPATY